MKRLFEIDAVIRDFNVDPMITYNPPKFIIEIGTPSVVGESSADFNSRQLSTINSKVKNILNTANDPLIQLGFTAKMLKGTWE